MEVHMSECHDMVSEECSSCISIRVLQHVEEEGIIECGGGGGEVGSERGGQ